MGYDGISLVKIAAAAEVMKNVVPYHFGVKANLWRESAEHTFAPVKATIEISVTNAAEPFESKQIAETFVRAVPSILRWHC